MTAEERALQEEDSESARTMRQQLLTCLRKYNEASVSEVSRVSKG